MLATEHSARNSAPVEPGYLEIALDRIQPSPLNPRRTFDAAELQTLADSIRAHGLLQPIVVRPSEAPDGPPWTIVAGERRYHACRLAGLAAVTCAVVADLPDAEALELTLIENLQRRDLDPVEEARGYRRLAELGLKQGEIARRVGRAQPTVANALRLLDLPEPVQAMVSAGEISAAHGRALARFAPFPEVCSAVARLAVQRHTPSKDLEKGLPFMWDAAVSNVVRELGGYLRPAFDPAECEGCAARHGSRYERRCLNPPCFDAKQAAAVQAQAEALRAQIEAADGDFDPLPTTDQVPEGGVWINDEERVRACRERGCPHLLPVHSRQLGTPVWYCTDSDCLVRFEVERRRQAVAELERAQAERARRIAEAFDRAGLGPREVAVLAATLLYNRGAHVRAVFERRGLGELFADGFDVTDWRGYDDRFAERGDRLAALPAQRLLLATAEALLSSERLAAQADWYLAAAESDPTEGPQPGGERE